MVCEYNSKMHSRLCPWLLTWSNWQKTLLTMMVGTTMPVWTRNVSQSVACRVVGMMWVINAAWYLLLSCRLALHGNIILGHVTNCKSIIWYCNGWLILLSARVCGFMTHRSWDHELYAYRVFRMGNPGSPQQRCQKSRWWLVSKARWEPQEEGMMSTAASLPLVMKPRFNRTSRRKLNFRRWCLLASWHSGQGHQINCLSTCSFSPAATWNLHTTQPRTLLPTYDEVVNLTGLL
jgi:hypothetical protein